MGLRAKYLKKQDLRDYLDFLLYDKIDYQMNAESFEERLREQRKFKTLKKQCPKVFNNSCVCESKNI